MAEFNIAALATTSSIPSLWAIAFGGPHDALQPNYLIYRIVRLFQELTNSENVGLGTRKRQRPN